MKAQRGNIAADALQLLLGTIAIALTMGWLGTSMASHREAMSAPLPWTPILLCMFACAVGGFAAGAAARCQPHRPEEPAPFGPDEGDTHLHLADDSVQPSAPR